MDRALVDAAALALVTRTQAVDPKSALSLAGQLSDTLLREDALWLIGARETADQEARKLFKTFDPRSFPKGAAMALYRGCIDAATRKP